MKRVTGLRTEAPAALRLASHARMLGLAPASTSYETAGRALRLARRLRFLEEPLRRLAMPDYISNYFPLADGPLGLGDALLRSGCAGCPSRTPPALPGFMVVAIEGLPP